MRVVKWGNDLAVRLRADLVGELGLREGDEVEIVVHRASALVASPYVSLEALLLPLRRSEARCRAISGSGGTTQTSRIESTHSSAGTHVRRSPAYLCSWQSAAMRHLASITHHCSTKSKRESIAWLIHTDPMPVIVAHCPRVTICMVSSRYSIPDLSTARSAATTRIRARNCAFVRM